MAENIMKITNLSSSYGNIKALKGIDIEINKGEIVSLLGANGAGKSTLMKSILGMVHIDEGSILYKGQELVGKKSHEIVPMGISLVPEGRKIFIELSVEKNLEIGTFFRKRTPERDKELLDMVEMPASVMGRYPNELSGGQRQRIAIARAMALDPDVIVCDEAVSALDVLVQDQVLRLLNDLQAEKGLSYLFITHDLAVVRQIADEVVVMQHGKLVEHATTDEVFDHPQKQYTRDLLDAIPGGKLQLGLD